LVYCFFLPKFWHKAVRVAAGALVVAEGELVHRPAEHHQQAARSAVPVSVQVGSDHQIVVTVDNPARV
jgi:hypothetical protein